MKDTKWHKYTLKLDGKEYWFDTLNELVDMLKSDDYECTLTIKQKRKFKKTHVNLNNLK